MGIGNIFKAFQPKDKVFFVLFEKVANNLVEMSEYFHNGIKNFDFDDDSLLKKIHDFEHHNDDLTHQIYVELGKNFITPFDREDIHSLATSLDDIADYIYASTRYIFLMKSPQNQAYEEFSLLINKACIKINSIENIADDVQSAALIKLFETNDPINIIKVQQVLDYLEEVTDKAEDVASVMNSIIIKYT